MEKIRLNEKWDNRDNLINIFKFLLVLGGIVFILSSTIIMIDKHNGESYKACVAENDLDNKSGCNEGLGKFCPEKRACEPPMSSVIEILAIPCYLIAYIVFPVYIVMIVSVLLLIIFVSKRDKKEIGRRHR